nr:BCCT family transporter [Aeromonas sp.]
MLVHLYPDERSQRAIERPQPDNGHDGTHGRHPVPVARFSRFGSIRLGDDAQVPESGYVSRFSMLFSAGMGFWSVAAPMNHLQGSLCITKA